jgi:hypothetical protein
VLGGSRDVSRPRQVGAEQRHRGFGGNGSLRDRMPWKRTKRTIHSTEERSVRMESWCKQSTAPGVLHRGVSVVAFSPSQTYKPAVVIP